MLLHKSTFCTFEVVRRYSVGVHWVNHVVGNVIHKHVRDVATFIVLHFRRNPSKFVNNVSVCLENFFQDWYVKFSIPSRLYKEGAPPCL